MKKSHNIKGIILAVVMLLLIVGYYYYLSRSGDKLSADTARGCKIFQPDHTMLLQ